MDETFYVIAHTAAEGIVIPEFRIMRASGIASWFATANAGATDLTVEDLAPALAARILKIQTQDQIAVDGARVEVILMLPSRFLPGQTTTSTGLLAVQWARGSADLYDVTLQITKN